LKLLNTNFILAHLELFNFNKYQRNNLTGLTVYHSLNSMGVDYISYPGMLHVLIYEKLDNEGLWIISNLSPDGEETNLSRLIKSNEKQ
jgi:hypothetical protein